MVASEEEGEGEHGVGESELQITQCKINDKDVQCRECGQYFVVIVDGA